MSNVDLYRQDCRNEGFMLTINEVWNRVCSPENQFLTSTVENGGPCPP